MASIFISYRRTDAGGHAGRLCDRLTARFGGDRVFLDIQDIHPGQNYATSIEDTIATCDCVIAVIGPHWLETIRTRAQSGGDFVRHEIALALKRQVARVPVLVGGAQMPAAGDLPTELAELSFLNAIEVRDEKFDQDVEELERFLATVVHAPDKKVEQRDAAPGSRRLALAVAAIAVVCAISGYLWLRRPPPGTASAAVPAAAGGRPPPGVRGGWGGGGQKTGPSRFRVWPRGARVGARLARGVGHPTPARRRRLVAR